MRILGAFEKILVGALSNLVCNAVQASGEAPEIHVSVNAADAGTIQIRVFVITVLALTTSICLIFLTRFTPPVPPAPGWGWRWSP